MLVVAFDPGFSNLGLAVVELERAGGRKCLRKILHSENQKVGSAAHPLHFPARVNEILDSLAERFGPFDGMALECPTFIMHQVRTSSLLWMVAGAALSWAAARNLPVRALSPMQLKRVASDLLGLIWERKTPPSKQAVARAICRAFDTDKRPRFETSHEADAVLAAVACWGVLGSTDAP